MRKLSLLAIITTVFTWLTTANTSLAAISAGDQAPDFSLLTSNGTTYNIASDKGKVIVLEWFNHECPFVRKHYDSGNMQSLQQEFTDRGVVWLSIISSAPGKQGHVTQEEARKNIKADNAKPSEVLLDPSGEVGKLYGAKTTPHMFVINQKGEIAYTGAIDSINSANALDVQKATPYTKIAINELLDGKPVSNASTKQYGCTVKY